MGKKRNVRRDTDPAQYHQKQVARRTYALHCIGARILSIDGSIGHIEAAQILGKPLPEGCNCPDRE